MAEKREIVRRVLGAFFLLASVVMLVAGRNALDEHLRSHPWEFIVFWLSCFVFVGLALLMALLDMRAVRSRVQKEERQLMESTLHQIAEAKELKAKKRPDNSVN